MIEKKKTLSVYKKPPIVYTKMVVSTSKSTSAKMNRFVAMSGGKKYELRDSNDGSVVYSGETWYSPTFTFDLSGVVGDAELWIDVSKYDGCYEYYFWGNSGITYLYVPETFTNMKSLRGYTYTTCVIDGDLSNLETFYSYSTTYDIDFSQCVNMKSFSWYGTAIFTTEPDFRNSPLLEVYSHGYNSLFDIGNHPMLKRLSYRENTTIIDSRLNSVNLPNLTYLNVSEEKNGWDFTTIDLSGLETLAIDSSQDLIGLNTTYLPNLISINYNRLNTVETTNFTLNFPNMTGVTIVNSSGSYITNLVVNTPLITTLTLEGAFRDIDITACTNLYSFIFRKLNTDMAVFDLKPLTALRRFSFQYAPLAVGTIDIANGLNHLITLFEIKYMSKNQTIKVDDPTTATAQLAPYTTDIWKPYNGVTYTFI